MSHGTTSLRMASAAKGMVFVPGSTFAMGSDKYHRDEAPVHRVAVDGFWIDETLVTNRCLFEAEMTMTHFKALRPLVVALLLPTAGLFGGRAYAQTDPLPSWADTGRKGAIIAFVDRITKEGGADFVAVPERIAVFDNDGTLWAEQPMYFQLAFAIDRVAAYDRASHVGKLDKALDEATAKGWTVVDMKNDWSQVLPEQK